MQLASPLSNAQIERALKIVLEPQKTSLKTKKNSFTILYYIKKCIAIALWSFLAVQKCKSVYYRV